MAPPAPTGLPELPASQATGETRRIYTSIEAALGVKLVNLVYRHLATVPGALEWAWDIVGGSFRDGHLAREAASLLDGASEQRLIGGAHSVISLKKCGLTPSEATDVLETLDVYNRANPMNALSLRMVALALADGRRAPAARVYIESDKPLVALLPMGTLDGLEADTAAHLKRLSTLVTGENSGLTPSLFRHFIPWPALLKELGDWLEPLVEIDGIASLTERVTGDADAVAARIFGDLRLQGEGLPPPGGKTGEALSSTIALFLPAICSMIVIGGLLRKSLAD